MGWNNIFWHTPYVMKLIRYGTYLALQQHREQLDLGILAVAFEKYVHADKTDKINPFISDEFEIQEQKPQSTELTVGATNNRLKSKPKKRRDPASPTGARDRSTRQLKASSVLTTK